MSKKLYDHLTSVNYGNIKTKIKQVQKKKKTPKISKQQDMGFKI